MMMNMLPIVTDHLEEATNDDEILMINDDVTRFLWVVTTSEECI